MTSETSARRERAIAVPNSPVVKDLPFVERTAISPCSRKKLRRRRPRRGWTLALARPGGPLIQVKQALTEIHG